MYSIYHRYLNYGYYSPTACVDTQTDKDSCGVSDKACTRWCQTCESGACTCPSCAPTFINNQCAQCNSIGVAQTGKMFF